MSNITRECSHLWRIKNYSRVSPEIGKSVTFSAPDDDFKWCLELTQRYGSVSDVIVAFNLGPAYYGDLRKYKYESVSGNMDIVLMNVITEAALKHRKSSFSLSFDEPKRNCKVAEFDVETVQQYLNEKELLILCNLTYTVTISSSNNSNAAKMSECRLLSDMERCFTDDHFKDVTISVKGKQYRAHKTILASRSTVFDRMLRVDMLESKKNHIDITDVDQEPFEEMLYYIYTGKVKNLDESAFELLPLADKYDLKELRSMCEEVLLKEISTDNAARILILADTHSAEELKERALRFIKENYASCKEFNDTEVWKHLAASNNFQLMNDIMAACCKK